MKYQTYTKYKPSGVEWIGFILFINRIKIYNAVIGKIKLC